MYGNFTNLKKENLFIITLTFSSAAAVHGIMKAGFTYAYVTNEFLLTYEPKISLQADIDFYSGIKLCIQLQRPEMQLK